MRTKKKRTNTKPVGGDNDTLALPAQRQRKPKRNLGVRRRPEWAVRPAQKPHAVDRYKRKNPNNRLGTRYIFHLGRQNTILRCCGQRHDSSRGRRDAPPRADRAIGTSARSIMLAATARRAQAAWEQLVERVIRLSPAQKVAIVVLGIVHVIVAVVVMYIGGDAIFHGRFPLSSRHCSRRDVDTLVQGRLTGALFSHEHYGNSSHFWIRHDGHDGGHGVCKLRCQRVAGRRVARAECCAPLLRVADCIWRACMELCAQFPAPPAHPCPAARAVGYALDD